MLWAIKKNRKSIQNENQEISEKWKGKVEIYVILTNVFTQFVEKWHIVNTVLYIIDIPFTGLCCPSLFCALFPVLCVYDICANPISLQI